MDGRMAGLPRSPASLLAFHPWHHSSRRLIYDVLMIRAIADASIMQLPAHLPKYGWILLDLGGYRVPSCLIPTMTSIFPHHLDR